MADQDCPVTGELVEIEIDRVATQYREAEKFLGLMRAYLGQVEEAARAICVIPTFFDIDSAIGDQLTLLGKRLGFPRCHCICDIAPVVGFDDCPPGSPWDGLEIVGFCEVGTWLACNDIGLGQVCIDDDETYRGFLRARRYQMLGLYDIASLQAALRHIWGAQAFVADAARGRVVIAPMRALSGDEARLIPLVVRVLPIAPGIRTKVHLSLGVIAGFGTGWGDFCSGEATAPEGALIITETGAELVTEGGILIATEPLSVGAQWLCETEPHAYDCETAA